MKRLDLILDELASNGLGEEGVLKFVEKRFAPIYGKYNFRMCLTFKN
jgi:hypothetical protein